MAQPHIMIATPCFGGLVTKGYTISLLQAAFAASASGVKLNVHLVGGDALITRARSSITADFLDIPEATHLLFVDADISFEPEQLFRVLAADKDVAAAMYPIKSIAWHEMAERAREGEPLNEAGLTYTAKLCTGAAARVDNDFAAADYAATGFLLIKRHVFERMIAAYPETKFKHVGVPQPGETERKNLYALYECIIDPETGHYMSEDYSFCRRWRNIGGEIWVDLKSKLTHEGPFQFQGNTERRYAGVK